MKNKWDESDLFTEIPKIEEKYLSSLPKEEDLHHVFSDSFEQKMAAMIDAEPKKKRTTGLFLGSHRAIKVAAVLLLVVIGSVTTALAMEPVRHAIFHFFRETFPEYTSILVHQEEESSHSDETFWIWKPLEPASPVEGFEEKLRNQTDQYLEITYQNTGEKEILFITYPLGEEELLIDTEGTILHKKEVQGVEFSYVEKNGTCSVFWHDETSQFQLSGEADRDALLLMAQKLKSAKSSK